MQDQKHVNKLCLLETSYYSKVTIVTHLSTAYSTGYYREPNWMTTSCDK